MMKEMQKHGDFSASKDHIPLRFCSENPPKCLRTRKSFLKSFDLLSQFVSFRRSYPKPSQDKEEVYDYETVYFTTVGKSYEPMRNFVS